MNSFKKILALLLCGVMLCSLAACGDGGDKDTKKQWKMDKENHWTESKDGKRDEVAAHTFDINGFCTVCNALMTTETDGSLNLQTFNEKGDISSWVGYDAAGEQDTDRQYEYKYDIAGNKEEAKVYNNGALELEATYGKDINGEDYIAEQTAYNDDGSKSYTKSNEHNDTVEEITYDTEGEVETSRRYEYEYDENNLTTHLNIYENEMLIEDCTYNYDKNGDTYPCKRIEYWLDGSITTTEYDENGEVLSEVYYDALLGTTEKLV